MATWVACIVDTKSRPDFWDVARRMGVRPSTAEVPAYALIDCDCGLDFLASIRLAGELSRELSTMCIGFVAQTNTDVHVLRTFVDGAAIRRVEYNREGGGWGIIEGEPQPWEGAYFFGEERTASGNYWPDMLSDEISPEDRARYEEAKRIGDPSTIMELLHPSSLAPMWRVCEVFGIDEGERPAGIWKKPSMWSRLRLRVSASTHEAASSPERKGGAGSR
jgi:hypothetical protein